MREKEPQSVPVETVIGLGAMAVGGLVGIAGTAIEITQTMYINLANIIEVGKEIPPGMSDSARNIMMAGLAITAAGAISTIRSLVNIKD